MEMATKISIMRFTLSLTSVQCGFVISVAKIVDVFTCKRQLNPYQLYFCAIHSNNVQTDFEIMDQQVRQSEVLFHWSTQVPTFCNGFLYRINISRLQSQGVTKKPLRSSFVRCSKLFILALNFSIPVEERPKIARKSSVLHWQSTMLHYRPILTARSKSTHTMDCKDRNILRCSKHK